MKTLERCPILCVLVCLVLASTLGMGTVQASAPQQGQADFAAIDAYLTEQVNDLGIVRITLPSMLVFQPELGYTLIAIAALGIGWSVIYAAMNLERQS